jgi:hypothetical protein
MADPFLEAKINWTPIDYYNYDDLNRVESMIVVVWEQVEKYRFKTVNLDDNISNRTKESIEFADSLRRIESNILLLGTELNFPTGFINPNVLWVYNSAFSYEDANRLEKNLVILNDYVTKQIGAWRYCGQYTVGDEGVS